MILSKSTLLSSPFEHHLVNAKAKRKSGKKRTEAILMLTSMVDMFSMIVVFLLQTFSSTPEIMLNKDIMLPKAGIIDEIKEAPVLAINNKREIFLDQKYIGKVNQLIRNPAKLVRSLKSLRASFQRTQGQAPQNIALQASREISSTEISEVLGIVTQSRFGNIQLQVLTGGT